MAERVTILFLTRVTTLQLIVEMVMIKFITDMAVKIRR